MAASLLSLEKANLMMQAIEQERDSIRTVNEVDTDEEAPQQRESLCVRLSPAELAAELERREQLMQTGKSSGVTDQWRVYTSIINGLRLGTPLRIMVQASAGTGKSFLLTSVYLWCLVHFVGVERCKAMQLESMFNVIFFANKRTASGIATRVVSKQSS